MLNDKDPEFWQDPAWYRALERTERPATPEAGTGVPASANGEAVGFRSEAGLLAPLAAPDAGLRARAPVMPDWLATLKDAFAAPYNAEQMRKHLQNADVDHPLAGCLPAIGPLLQHGLTLIHERARALHQQYSTLPFDPVQLSQSFLSNIAPDLLFRLGKPMILEMHIARLEGRLAGETPVERFADFLRQMSEDQAILPLLAKYPVLARQLVITIDHWADYVCEFLTHLCADWQTICTTFAPGAELGQLVTVRAGMGDTHRKGRSVLLLGFDSGMQLLYKPKPLAVDLHFQELLTWLNEKGADPPLRPLKLIERGDYGWSEFVESSSCASHEEVGRFYERQGSYLALLYALTAVDLHNENVIASGEHPMLVDLEALFHPRIGGTDWASPGNLAAKAMDQSVWQVGLLPRRLWSTKDSEGVDMSGLGGQAGQKMPHPLYRWEEAGSDQMRLVREYIDMPVGENRPQLDGQEVEVTDYRNAIVAGFTKMYRLLCEHRDALLAEQLPRFENDAVRVVVRSTRIYGTLLFESFHPDLLRDALEREHFFDRLRGEVKQQPYLARIIPAEQRDLLRGDIPLFTALPASRTIFDSEKEPIPDFLDTPSLDVARDQIRQLGEHDLARQVWIIDASLATLLMGGEDAKERSLPIKPIGHPVARERLLALADAVGKRLAELALQDDAGAYWIGVNYVDENIWSLFPTGTDLYNGTSGIALFLSYLGAITGEPSHSLLARRSLASVRAQTDELTGFGEDFSIGAFDGLASLIYLLAHLGELWREPGLFQQAEGLVERLPALISKDEQPDIINGSAGCILSLLALYAVHPSPRIQKIAVQCGDHLLAAAQPMPQGIAWQTIKDERPLGGFSHGTAGIAYSLLKLAAKSGEERFHQAALAALAYDRSLYLPSLNNWADLRVFPARRRDLKQPNETLAEPGQKSMVAWCHGAPGIGLGRLAALEFLDDAKAREEIDIALNTTIQQGFAGNHSLCHGALGNLELLLTAVQLLGRPEDREALERATAVIVGSIEANGWVSAVPLGVETPSLMTGLAGIGYELLRLAEPGRVPPVLLLAPPRLQPFAPENAISSQWPLGKSDEYGKDGGRVVRSSGTQRIP